MLKVVVKDNINDFKIPDKIVFKQDVLRELGVLLQKDIQQNISSGKDVYGNSVTNKSGTRPLWKSGHMHASIELDMRVGSFTVFSRLDYTNYVDKGTDRIDGKNFFTTESGEIGPNSLNKLMKRIEEIGPAAFEGF